MAKRPSNPTIEERFAEVREWLATRPFRGPSVSTDYTTGHDRPTDDDSGRPRR